MYEASPFLLLVLAYLVGSFPTGYVFARLAKGIDITRHGSGNIGASNVARVLGLQYFAYIFFIDAAKAFIFLKCVACRINGSDSAQYFLYVLAAALLLGNAFSVFLNFKGGKGVATGLGIVTYFVPFPCIILFVLTWLVMLVVFAQPFIASLVSIAVLLVFYAVFYGLDTFFTFLVCLFIWSLVMHYQNIINFLRHNLRR
ncbi:MAG: glycerol-3-phosphate acyltransferase [Epsilonproteobacteria bacterium]|nr:glycerol-3-phosphate acyltransferase [Campylobacterota bacterium]